MKYLLLETLKLEQQNQILPIKCITDSKSLHDTAYLSKTLTEKRLKTELCAIRESLEKEGIHSVTWVNSSDQLADCLTKDGTFREKLYDIMSGKSNTKLYLKNKKWQREKNEMKYTIVNVYFVAVIKPDSWESQANKSSKKKKKKKKKKRNNQNKVENVTIWHDMFGI